MKSNHSLASSTAVYQNQTKTRDMKLAEAEYADHQAAMGGDRKHGVKNHLFIGHGPTQDTFEKRDFATTNDMVYERKANVEQIIDPNTFEGDMGKTRSKKYINT